MHRGDRMSEMIGMIELLNQNLDILLMDDEVRDKFNAIKVATKMIGESPVEGTMYTPSFCQIEGETKFETTIDLWGGFRFIRADSPTFLWSLWTGESMQERNLNLIIKCEEDYTIKYPIPCYIIIPDNVEFNRATELDKKLDRDDLILFLDSVLHNL